MSIHGYDPIRIELLRTRTHEAVDALRSIHCDDPLAADAMHAASLMCQNLEEMWVPLVDAIHASRAMVTWRRSTGLVTGMALSPSLGSMVSSLVDRLDELSGWVTTTGLEHLDDAELADRLDDATADFVLAARTGDDVLAAWTEIDLLATETAQRLRADEDGSFTEVLWTTLGPDGLRDVVAVIDTTGQITDLDLMAGTADARAANDRLQTSLGTVVGTLASSHDEAHDRLVELAPGSSHLADAVAASPDAFAPPVLVGLATELVGATSGDGGWASMPPLHDRHRATGTILATVARSPATSLQLLSDEDVVTAITTDGHYSDDDVEALVASALGAPGRDPRLLGDGLETLADLVELTKRSELNPGTRRGVAVSIGVYLPAISIQLDPRLPVDVSLPSDDGAGATASDVIRLGSYDDVTRLLGQVVDDVPAQLAMGVSVGAFRSDQTERAVVTLRARPDFDARAAGVHLAADLAGVSRVIDAVTAAIEDRNELLAFRHGLAQADARAVVTLYDTTVSAFPVLGPAASHVSRFTTRGVTSLIGSTTPATVPDTGFDAELKMHFTMTALGVPLHQAGLRRRFGVDAVPAETWHDLEQLAEEFDDADDADARSAIHSRILRLVDGSPDLQIYMTEVGVLSGDTTLD